MPSLKSHLFAFVLKRTRKKSFASVDGLHARLKAARETEDHRPPEEIRKRLDITEREVGGALVYEVDPKNGAGDRRIVYLHGGAYLFELTAHHWKLIAELAERLRVRISVSVYPLAPEHKAPQIIGTGMALYRDVLKETPAENIVFMGDSAGGNMALVMSLTAAAEGLPQPGALVAISPSVDTVFDNPDIAAVEKKDPWLGVPGVVEAAKLYADGIDLADWRVSPLQGDLSALPPSLVLTGTRDILNPDTHLFVEKARNSGVDIELFEKKGMFHVWPLLDMPEAREARDHIVAWLGKHFPAVRPGETAD